ncbi:MAG: saccharopine dehydrogenase NADP-binding domain-containing protein [Phaeodactylibacter sp.]|nr:saccharopine dehydrogenase NADP-binding domain-containing protein [Phaeodactylibacter sp.]MCB9274169.1 saccharopine dehydrogenase NADP-binding domain-containing protein [Lewinellaceae bacterium]
MNSILIIGAGRSATACIKYVLDKARERNWFVTVADADPKLAEAKVAGHPNGRGTWLDVMKVNDRRELIGRADVVVSLLPAYLHLEVAHDCIKLKKHLITASYVSQEMYQLADEVRSQELIFMGEMGLDPGIDHMSAMQQIHAIKAKGGEITAFRSYTGGLVAPESDDNPWHYKITWNPRNVVLAGQGTAQYLENGKHRYIPYNRLFKEYRLVNVPGMGEYEAYANRDSLLYREAYGLGGIPNILRGTLRGRGFCDAWNALVKIGLTDGSYPILGSSQLTYHELMEAYLNPDLSSGSVKERIANFIKREPDSEVMKKLEWLGLFSKKKIRLKNATPAHILEHLLLDKWKLRQQDKDMIIMQHEFEYKLEGRKHQQTSTLVMKGEDADNTAMSRLVGLPLGIFVKEVMEGKINRAGVNIPVMPEFYEPVLEELKAFGVVFREQHKAL